MVHDPISVLDALMIALSGIVIVFLMLALLWAAAPAPAPVPQVKLEGVSEVEAACVMAIVSHETGIPLDQLVFKSIKAV